MRIKTIYLILVSEFEETKEKKSKRTMKKVQYFQKIKIKCFLVLDFDYCPGYDDFDFICSKLFKRIHKILLSILIKL